MTPTEPIEIPLSKKKMILSLLGSLLFVAIGLWFMISPPQGPNPFLRSPTVAFVVGLASVLFFGLVAVVVARKLPGSKAGLTIDSQGVFDNASGVSAGLVLWSDIQEISVMQVMNQKFLMLIVKNPEEYISRQTNALKRKGMQMNWKNYGSPVSISATSLQTNFDELHRLLQQKLQEHSSKRA